MPLHGSNEVGARSSSCFGEEKLPIRSDDVTSAFLSDPFFKIFTQMKHQLLYLAQCKHHGDNCF
jgi:hypothetical protein